jgi:hypothetical protein
MGLPNFPAVSLQPFASDSLWKVAGNNPAPRDADKDKNMKHTLIMTTLAITLAVGTPRTTHAIGFSMDHLQTIAQNVMTSLLSQYLRDYLKQFVDPATGDHEGTLTEDLSIHTHRGGSYISKRYGGIPEPYQWGRYREFIEKVNVDGVYKSVYTRFNSNYLNEKGILMTSPFNPYHTGKYSTNCEEYSLGSDTVKKVTADGSTVWQMKVTASNLGGIMKEGIGLQTVIGMQCRYMPPFCPTAPYPLIEKFVSANVKWNDTVLVHPPENQIYIPFLRYYGGNLWRN